MSFEKKKQKEPFADLSEEFKDKANSSTDEELKRIASETAFAQHENLVAQKDDQDLAEKKEQAKIAGEQYAQATKTNKLKIKYIYQLLEARGKV